MKSTDGLNAELTNSQRISLRGQNRKRLLALGFPDDFFSPGFWEREMAARKAELEMLTWMEAQWRAGEYEGLVIPWEAVFERWRASIAHPLHFASRGWRPRWVDACNDAASDWRQRERGTRQAAWAKYQKKYQAKKRAAKGK